jgi:hypothetical protein
MVVVWKSICFPKIPHARKVEVTWWLSARTIISTRTWRIVGFGAWCESPTIGYQLYSRVVAVFSLVHRCLERSITFLSPMALIFIFQYPWPGMKRGITRLICVVTNRWSVNGFIIICVRILCCAIIDLRYILSRRVALSRCPVLVSLSDRYVIPCIYKTVLSNQRIQCSALLVVICSAVGRTGTVQITTKDAFLPHLAR